MALGFKGSVAQSLLDAFGNNTSYTGPAAIYMKLHTGDPGSAGATSAAGNTSRQSCSWGAASTTSSVTSIANDVALTWTSVSTSETYTHFSLWDASTAGNFLGTGTVTANAVTSGDTFTIAIGGATYALNAAA